MGYSIEYLGHSAIFIRSCEGKKILVDPYLSENEHASLKPEAIDELDMILVSHGAFDHMGDMVEIAKRTGAVIFSDIAVVNYAIHCGIPKEQTRAMIWGTNLIEQGVEIRSVEAKHINHFTYDGIKVTGAPMSFIIRMEDGTGIYFSGDTAIFSDMKLFGELYPVHIGFFCVSGLPGYAYEMDGREAAMAAGFFGVDVAVPVHYPPGSREAESFCLEFERTCPGKKALAMKPGERYEGQ